MTQPDEQAMAQLAHDAFWGKLGIRPSLERQSDAVRAAWVAAYLAIRERLESKQMELK